MALLDKLNNNRAAYQALPGGKDKSSLTVRLVAVFFVFCFVFGISCFYWTHIRELYDDPDRVTLQLGLPPPPSLRSFPKEFLLGCASSSYQVEGGWDADGKGENIWDHMVHIVPSPIVNNDTGDVSCDSYHKYKEDVQLIKGIGFNHYRFSISWSRVLPTGHDDTINRAGLDYYHRLIDELLANGVTPMVTLYHWDLPQPLQELGGWTNPLLADYFENYARVIFSEFAHKVKWWITLNEPRNVVRGYGVPDRHLMAPMVSLPGIADYLTVHTLLRAHARAYHLYDKHYRPAHGGKIFITLDAKSYFPLTDSQADKMAAQRAAAFEVGIFAHPIFSKTGDYPPVVRQWVDRLSRNEGRTLSRLPTFTLQEIDNIRGSSDLFGLNHYTSELVEAGSGETASLVRDAGVTLTFDPSWPTGKSAWLKVVPEGFRRLLNYVKTEFNNPMVFITENGFSSDNKIDDYDRIQYFNDYLEQMLLAIYQDGCHVIGYTAWSILDNFEWARGYTERFGLHYVDFSDPSRPRAMKKSAAYFKKLIEKRELPDVRNNTQCPYDNSCDTELEAFYDIA